MKKIVDFDKYTTKQKILLLILLILVLSVGIKIIKILTTTSWINYSTANKDTFLNQSTENNDREVYWILNDIIVEYISSYSTEEIIDDVTTTKSEYTFEESFNCLDEYYQKYLGETKYYETAKNMFNKFIYIGEYELKQLKVSKPIKNMYKIKNKEDIYFCELNTVDSNDTSYILISLDRNLKTYSILYIE